MGGATAEVSGGNLNTAILFCDEQREMTFQAPAVAVPDMPPTP
jgi:hypothetical protein